QLVLEIVYQQGQLSGCTATLQPRKVAFERDVIPTREPAIQIQHDPPSPDGQFQIVPWLAHAPASGHYCPENLSGSHDGHRKRCPDDGRSAVPIRLGEGAPEGLVEREIQSHCLSSPLSNPVWAPAYQIARPAQSVACPHARPLPQGEKIPLLGQYLPAEEIFPCPASAARQ